MRGTIDGDGDKTHDGYTHETRKERRGFWGVSLAQAREGQQSQTQNMASAHLPSLERVEFWSYIEVEAESLARLGVVLAGVKVNDIVDSGAASINDPVVAIERLCVSEDAVDARFGCEGVGITTERDEFGTTASVTVG